MARRCGERRAFISWQCGVSQARQSSKGNNVIITLAIRGTYLADVNSNESLYIYTNIHADDTAWLVDYLLRADLARWSRVSITAL